MNISPTTLLSFPEVEAPQVTNPSNVMPVGSSMFYYNVISGADGSQQLEKVCFEEVSPQILEKMKAIVRGFTRYEDEGVLGMIAAGRSASLVFNEKSYKQLGLTKVRYCKEEFDRDPSTVRSYVAAATSYEDIGGVECSVQPNSINQLESLQKVRPEARRPLWLRLSELDGGKAPSGNLLLRQATLEGLLLPAKKTKPEPAPEKVELPCSTLEEAVEFATHHEKADKADAKAWEKMREFLQCLAQQGAEPATSKTKCPTKPKTFPVQKEQMDFLDDITFKNQNHHEQEDLALSAG